MRGLKAVTVLAIALALGVGTLAHGEDGSDTGTTLTVEIVGLRSDLGQVRIAVFDSEEDWLQNSAHAKVVDLESRDCSWTFEGVTAGEHGIVVFHDRNANGKNDRNLFGIPKEPYGFSNDVRATFGPPSWEKGKFEVAAGENTTIRIRVK